MDVFTGITLGLMEVLALVHFGDEHYGLLVLVEAATEYVAGIR